MDCRRSRSTIHSAQLGKADNNSGATPTPSVTDIELYVTVILNLPKIYSTKPNRTSAA
jgi:hypothetical protein